jgi:hypothetical protein
MLRDTMAIWWRLRVRHAYGTPRRPGSDPVTGRGPGGVATNHLPNHLPPAS